ncbi:autotransporter outer membrane beta-barrel domain-containing protein [Sphingomonas cavernae]|uniref:autotransporter outer membrane beta-barrel domain-containing protein n=1 Tax=Sphingomonas cavernae TaxID=2320861 RepID=UPI001600C0F6|nr:autotransporter outer membrane beta-barrel domain-containing protein [Sphingomonas cavernae]
MGVGGLALALSTTPARAECAPEGGVIVCSGLDANGFVSTVDGQVTTILAGATVRNNPDTGSAIRYDENGRVIVAGAIEGGDGDGIVGGPGKFVTISVGQGGAISGQRGIAAVDAFVRYAIGNAGTITGTSGAAIAIPDGSSGLLTQFRNAETGRVVGGVDGRFERIENTGVIDGGSRSGIASTGASRDQTIVNRGGIRSAATTGAAIAANAVIDNSGTIEGAGGAAAIRADELELVNRAGGVIRAGGTAIALEGADFNETSIENAGQIVGNVVSSGASSDHFVQRIGATVEGDIRLGAGDDAFYYEQKGDQIAGGVTGAIDGGDGEDIFGVRVTRSGTVTLAGALPTGFERYGVDLCGCNTDVTIAAGNYTAGLTVSGEGDVTNLASFTTTGKTPIIDLRSSIEEDIDPDFGLVFVNKGTIDATGTEFGFDLITSMNGDAPLRRFVNDGVIKANGFYTHALNLMAFGGADGPGFVNNGEIGGAGDSGYGINLTSTNAENNGKIIFTGGDQHGVRMTGGSFTNNAGAVIQAQQDALTVQFGRVRNSGTITGNVGVAVISGTIINEAGGVITGGRAAIVRATGFGAGVNIANKGTINGHVDLTDPGSDFDTFWAAEGSKLNGQLRLGNNDKLVTDIGRVDRTGTLRIDDIVTGGVTNGSSNELWLRAGSTQSANLIDAPVAGFTRLVYEAGGEDMVLTLGGPVDAAGAVQTRKSEVRLAGDGKINLTADIDVSGLIQRGVVVERYSTPNRMEGSGRTLDLVISGKIRGGRGIAVDATHANSVELAAGKGEITIDQEYGLVTGPGTQVTIGEGAKIRVLDANNRAIAISAGGSTIVNRGEIVEEGDAATATRGNAATGVEIGSGYFENAQSGRVDMIGSAVELRAYAVLENSGLIQSRGGAALNVAAVDARNAFDDSAVINNAGGTIRAAGGTAIAGRYGGVSVQNAGTIDGNILLSQASDSFAADAYVAMGGTVSGNLDFGGGDDLFLVRDGASAGISGTINAGDGLDAYGRSFTSSGTYALGASAKPADFELHAAEALGEATTVKLTAAETLNTGIRLYGDGTIENGANVDVNGIADLRAAIDVRTGDVEFGAMTLINTGNISSDVQGVLADDGVRSFANSGTISATKGAVEMASYVGNKGFAFRNDGTLASDGAKVDTARVEFYGATEGAAIDVVNAGTIRSGGTADYQGEATGLLVSGADDVFARIANSGTIEAGGVMGTGAVISGGRFDVANSGTIEGKGVGGAGLIVASYAAPDPKAPSAEDCEDGAVSTVVANVRNDGTIRANGGGTATVDSHAIAVGLGVSIENENTIVRVINGANGVIEATGAKSVAIAASSNDSSESGRDPTRRTFKFDNSGTVRGGAGASITDGLYVNEPGGIAFGDVVNGGGAIAGAIQTIHTTDRIRNLAGGVISGSVDLADGDDVFENYGRLVGDLTLGSGADTLLFAASSVLEGIAHGGEGVDTLLVDLTGNGAINFDLFKGFETLKQKGSGTLSISGTADLATLTIANSSVTIASGTRFATSGMTALTGSDGDENLNVEGTIAGNVDMGGGKDVVTLAMGGKVEGNVNLGAGDDRLVLAGGTATGTIDGGLGTDTIAFNIAGDVSAIPDGINFESLDVAGAGTLSLALQQDFDTITLGSGSNLVLNPGAAAHNVGTIIGNDGAQNVTINTPLTGGVSLGGGDDSLTLALNGVLSGALDGGAGNDMLNLNLGGASTIGGLAGFETVNLAGAAPLTLNGVLAQGQALNFDGGDNALIVGAGGSILGAVNGGAGRDSIAFDLSDGVTQALFTSRVTGFEDLAANGSGTLILNENAGYQSVAINGGNLTLAAGMTLSSGNTVFDGANNVLTLAGGASIIGPVDGGAGTDRLVLQQGAGETRSLNSLWYSNFEQLGTGGAGTLIVDGNASFDSVDMFGSGLKIVNGATLTTGQLTGSDAANTLEIAGALNGAVDLGAGDDRLIIASLNNGTGTRSGGAGNDTLEFRGAGTGTWNGTGYTGFENFANGAGTLSITGNVGFQTFAVTGGRVIGQAGTTIASANSILVGQGATFGSAGTVNASIDVRGTLSPGASPGTMTVNGNVAFASGSNLLLELAPTGRDLLNISGTLSIASGSTIDITGALSSAPGGALDLVVANGGITGGFTTINKSQSIFGFVAQRGNKIQIVGEFANDASFGTNAQASIAYANAVLGSGQKVGAFTAALPDLVDAQGKSKQAAFAQLTPEAYASASRIGIDNGLMIADTARSLRYTMAEGQGLFGFGQTMFARTELDGNTATGASAANEDSSGFLGGLGYGFGNGVRVGAFLGHLDSEQTLHELSASTKADGFVGGVFADAEIGALGLHALAAYDGADATTTRSLPGRTSATASYGLKSWLVDFSAHYDIALGGMALTPRAGLTYVSTRREGLTEQGTGAFGLSVEGKRKEALFADAGVTLGADTKLGNLPLRPWVEAGVRHMFDGDNVTASGVLTGVTAGGVLIAAGVDRDRTTARLGAGLGLEVSGTVSLNIGYTGEFGDAERHNINGGILIVRARHPTSSGIRTGGVSHPKGRRRLLFWEPFSAKNRGRPVRVGAIRRRRLYPSCRYAVAKRRIADWRDVLSRAFLRLSVSLAMNAALRLTNCTMAVDANRSAPYMRSHRGAEPDWPVRWSLKRRDARSP